MTGTVRVGKKGQITLPKKLRDEDDCKEGDRMEYAHMPNGDIVLRKQEQQDPLENLFATIKKMPKFDVDKAWNEIKAERKLERA
tara:strand:- start:118 stop:369 length:252 start_codon:yes stop_codon:yes gene_type:complete